MIPSLRLLQHKFAKQIQRPCRPLVKIAACGFTENEPVKYD